MKTKNPHYNLIIAEDIRPELNNKFSIMGVANAPIILDKSQGHDYAIYSLAAYGEFDKIKNSEQMAIMIAAPSGKLVSEGVVPIPKDDKDYLVVAGKFANLKFEESGIYELKVIIGEQEFKKKFTIKINK